MVEKMKPVDKKEEVLQYLRDNQDTIVELTKCDKFDIPEDFDSMMKNISMAMIMEDIETFRNTEGLSGMNTFVKDLVYVASGCESWPFLNLYGSSLSRNAMFRYDKTFDAIAIVAVPPFDTLLEMMPVDKIKSNISEIFPYLNNVSWKRVYLSLVGVTDDHTKPSPNTGICMHPYPCGAPYTDIMANTASSGKPKYQRMRKPKCSHYYPDGKHALYKSNPNNKSWKCNLCGRAIQPKQADKIIQASTTES